MTTKRSLTVVTLLVVTAAVAGSLAGTANAQAVLKGTFTLPYEVRWGQAVLPAGEYSITFDSLSRPARVTPATGRGGVFVMALAIDDASQDQPTALLVTRGERGRIVRSFNWREGGKAFVYKPFTKAERELLASASPAESVSIAMASK